MLTRLSTEELKRVSLRSLDKEAQTALEEVAKEQDEIINRGTVIEESLERALGEASKVVVDIW